MARATITRKIQVIGEPAEPGVPTWRQGQSVNAWREISGSAMNLCPPTVNPGGMNGPQSKLEAWCGLSIDTRTSTVWSVANGGHGDYYGNEINKISLDDDAPEWVEQYRSSTGFTIPNTTPRYSDGTPASAHSYYSQQFIESRNMAMRCGLGSMASSGSGSPVFDGFDATVAQGVDGWSDPEDFPSWPAFSMDLPVCKHPVTEDVYCFRENYSVFKWTNATNSISTINSGFPPDTMLAAASAVDPTRNRIFLANSKGAWTYSLDTNTFTARTLSGTGAGNVTQDYQAMVYEPELDAFLVLHVASASSVVVYVVDAATFAVSALSVTGTPPGPGTTNSARAPYTRFLYVPKHAGCIWFANYSANGWFLRTH